MSDAAFNGAVMNVLKWEGGYVDDPSDPGGETNFGISKRSYPDEDIANLTREDAIAIYRRDWWDKYHLGDFPDQIGVKMLDIAVNMGWTPAAKILQRAVNHYGMSLAVDGAIGPLSRNAIRTVCGAGSSSEATKTALFLSTLRVEDANHYRDIAANNPRLQKFLRGWLRRAAS